jgi:hypothetical protein
MSAAPRFATEKALWKHMATRLLGAWYRTEYATPPGLPDCTGLYRGRVHFVELKVGKPSPSLMRPEQVAFLNSCRQHGVVAWIAVGWRGRVHWFDNPDLAKETTLPPAFWRGL